MNRLSPIYTEPTECQDCYKCIRHCPVKAITVEQNSAKIMDEYCILCGKCVEICPVGAKKIRDDLGRAIQLIKKKKTVAVSLAPSWTADFEKLHQSKIIKAINELGVKIVSETALGAQIVSEKYADLLEEKRKGVFISSACPSINRFINKEFPQYKENLTPFLSPAQSHAKFLRETYGDDIGVIFISPCIAKKQEAFEYPDLIDVSITFKDFRAWFAMAEINPYKIEVDEDITFLPEEAEEGGLFPVEGGTLKCILANRKINNARLLSFSGMFDIKDFLQNLHEIPEDELVLCELLSCEGGCINGPEMSSPKGIGKKMIDVLANVKQHSKEKHYEIDVDSKPMKPVPKEKNVSQHAIYTELKKIGKTSKYDELNCGGCGYNTCRDFAKAMILKRAEPSMCVSYMRKLAMSKANALLRKMPAGVIIVNKHLKILESNKKFAELIGGDVPTVFDANPGLNGAYLQRLVPFSNLFEKMFRDKKDEITREIKHNNRFIRVNLFKIESERIVGGIIQDITNPHVRRDHIINKTRSVIKKNLETVQQIAFLLGENASESEILLHQIIDSFSENDTEE